MNSIAIGYRLKRMRRLHLHLCRHRSPIYWQLFICRQSNLLYAQAPPPPPPEEEEARHKQMSNVKTERSQYAERSPTVKSPVNVAVEEVMAGRIKMHFITCEQLGRSITGRLALRVGQAIGQQVLLQLENECCTVGPTVRQVTTSTASTTQTRARR